MSTQHDKGEVIREMPPPPQRKVIAQQVYTAPPGRNWTPAKVKRVERQSRILGEAIARIEDVTLEDVEVVRYDGY